MTSQNDEIKTSIQNLEKRVKKLENYIECNCIGKLGNDELFNEASKLVNNYELISASLLQRRLKIGYARAARILDELENAGIVRPGEGGKPREVIKK